MLSPSERARRFASLRAIMRQADADALIIVSRGIVGHRGLIRYISDFQVPSRQVFGVFLGDADPIMVVQPPSHGEALKRVAGLADVRARPRPIEEVADILAGMPRSPRRVLVAGLNTAMQVVDYFHLSERFADAKIEDATASVERLWLVKSAAEIELMREASRVADQGYLKFLEVVRPGRTEREVVADVEAALRYGGASEMLILIATSPHTPYIYEPSDHVLQPDEVINLNLECGGPSGYWVERNGTICLGEPTQQMRRLYDDAYRILIEGASLFRPGATAGDVAAKIKNLIEGCGYTMVTWTGHGIGLNVTESPGLLKDDSTPFEEGMCMAFHPQLVDRYGNGVYMGDVYLVTSDGGVGLTQVPFDLTLS